VRRRGRRREVEDGRRRARPGFADYAATHGIQALEGGGAATEVTADGLRLEAYDKSRP